VQLSIARVAIAVRLDGLPIPAAAILLGLGAPPIRAVW
jgi:hypothetical protein